MSTTASERLVIAISSRALFDLDESHQVFVEEGVDAYCRYQIEREEVVLSPGIAFPLVQKLLALNDGDPTRPKVEVILLSRNSADTGLRVFNSIRHHGLDISRAAFTRGESTYRYINAFGAHLFLSASQEDVRKALEAGCAAATILPSKLSHNESGQLRIAFDGDAVLFSDESERIYKRDGLGAFERNEQESARQPLSGGPFEIPCRTAPNPVLVSQRGLAHSHGAHHRTRSPGTRTRDPDVTRLEHSYRRGTFPGGTEQGGISQSLRRRHLLRRPARAL